MEPCFLTASQAVELYKTDELTVTELVTSTLARIRARDEAVKGWAYLDESLVLKRAKELDELPKSQRGPLHGITVAVKDVIYTKGALFPVRTDPAAKRTDRGLDMPTQHNSPMYQGSSPEIDAGESPRRLKPSQGCLSS